MRRQAVSVGDSCVRCNWRCLRAVCFDRILPRNDDAEKQSFKPSIHATYYIFPSFLPSVIVSPPLNIHTPESACTVYQTRPRFALDRKSEWRPLYASPFLTGRAQCSNLKMYVLLTAEAELMAPISCIFNDGARIRSGCCCCRGRLLLKLVRNSSGSRWDALAVSDFGTGEAAPGPMLSTRMSKRMQMVMTNVWWREVGPGGNNSRKRIAAKRACVAAASSGHARRQTTSRDERNAMSGFIMQTTRFTEGSPADGAAERRRP